jgi:hypothetical protein
VIAFGLCFGLAPGYAFDEIGGRLFGDH